MRLKEDYNDVYIRDAYSPYLYYCMLGSVFIGDLNFDKKPFFQQAKLEGCGRMHADRYLCSLIIVRLSTSISHEHKASSVTRIKS